jgi:hypothetical protein
VHRNNILIHIQKDATLHSFFYLETALHVSGGTNTYHQERIQLYSQHLVFVTPLLVHRNNILIYIQQDATLYKLFYLENALHVSGGTTTHRQERIQLYPQHLVFVTPLLVHRNNILIYIQQDATLHSLFYLETCSTCFGWYYHPSSREHTTVSTASGICHTVTAIS